VRVLILNQYFPPEPAPTGQLLAEVATALRQHGHTVTCLSAAQKYHDQQRFQGRMKREASALWALLRKALRAEKPNLILSGSSPPCLILVAALAARWHRARSVHWAMDLYPELAVTLGEVSPGLLPGMLSALMDRAYRGTEVVSVDADMSNLLERKGIASTPIRPWMTEAESFERTAAVNRRKPFRWLYSGNLGRAHEWQTLVEAQALLEARDCPATLVFQGRGAARTALEARIAELNLHRVELLDYAPLERFFSNLLEAGALVATQRPETYGMLWPSKLAVLTAIPRPLLWIGPPEGSVAREIETNGLGRTFESGQAIEVADWIEQLSLQKDDVVKVDLEVLKSARSSALDLWVRLIEG